MNVLKNYFQEGKKMIEKNVLRQIKKRRNECNFQD